MVGDYSLRCQGKKHKIVSLKSRDAIFNTSIISRVLVKTTIKKKADYLHNYKLRYDYVTKTTHNSVLMITLRRIFRTAIEPNYGTD